MRERFYQQRQHTLECVYFEVLVNLVRFLLFSSRAHAITVNP